MLESFHSREQNVIDRKGKRRETRSVDDGWTVNPIRWFQDSPKDERPRSAIPWKTTESKDKEEPDGEAKGHHGNGVAHDGEPSLLAGKSSISKRRATIDEGLLTSPRLRQRSSSLPQAAFDGKGSKARWAKLRSLLPNIQTVPQNDSSLPSASAVTSATVNITDEVITGGLSTLMLRLWFDRDEKGHRRVPIFLHRLRIRISDSYHPTEEKRTAFRIECEYANGAARWVIYRQLRDFVSLHTHYTVSNVYNRLGDELPEFPLTSKFRCLISSWVLTCPSGIPYLKFLKKEDANIDQASFARLQREALETYLIKLMRAVVSLSYISIKLDTDSTLAQMFHPSSNRLSGFLEVSALSISLAHSGGVQYKGGYLQMQAVNNGTGGFGRKGLGRRVRKELRWSSVRESYLVVVNEPGEVSHCRSDS